MHNRYIKVESLLYCIHMTHGSLFSGIGGFDLAAEWMGWTNVFHCEINPFGRRVLSYYWPDAISYLDIKTTDFLFHSNQIDVISGGFPCQPYSLAGKRKGKEDDRHLWPAMLTAIKAIQPRWIVGENVHGIINWSKGMVFNEVQSDLEAAGYEVFAYVLPACGINAPHRRDRTFFIAHSCSIGYGRIQSKSRAECEDPTRIAGTSQAEIIANTNRNGQFGSDSTNEIDADQRREYALNDTFEDCSRNVTNPKRERLERPKWAYRTIRFKQGIKEVLAGFENFPTQSPFCNGDDGIPAQLDDITFPKWRTESIKAGGNAIVPPIAYELFKTIEQYEQAQSHR